MILESWDTSMMDDYTGCLFSVRIQKIRTECDDLKNIAVESKQNYPFYIYPHELSPFSSSKIIKGIE